MKYKYWSFWEGLIFSFLFSYFVLDEKSFKGAFEIALITAVTYNIGQNLINLFNLYTNYLAKKTDKLERETKNG